MAKGLSEVLKQSLQPSNLENKLMAQAYDGAAIMSGNQSDGMLVTVYLSTALVIQQRTKCRLKKKERCWVKECLNKKKLMYRESWKMLTECTLGDRQIIGQAVATVSCPALLAGNANKFSLRERVYTNIKGRRSCAKTRCKFRMKFPNRPVPSAETIKRLPTRFKETGSMNNRKSNRKHSVLAEEKLDEKKSRLSMMWNFRVLFIRLSEDVNYV
ncbi:hypothetical protein ANN_09883 [Periplaneta americana]|uniref:DUF4817 domain-containing protein n=1 Tax=Periplaneta americana TaxID=6978 RepID=A0ABQ8TQJ0_PERAM|nr:hypothetical protein ANN_09883 [Periplaneta americana]